MSRRRRRQSLRPLIQLIPYFKPYWVRLVLVAGLALGFSSADVGRAMLVEPLLNRVLLRKGDVAGQAEDWLLEGALTDAARRAGALAAARVEVPPAGEVERIRVATPLLPAPPELTDEDLLALLTRTSSRLEGSAEDLSPEDTRWPRLARAVLLQTSALESATADGQVAITLSLTARELAEELEFEGVWAVLLRVFYLALALALALAVCHYGMHLVSRVVVARVHVDLQNKMASHLVTLSLGYFEGERRGDLLARLTNDLTLTSSAITTLTSNLLIQSIHLGVLAGSALLISWQLCLGLGVLAITVIAPLRWWGRRIRRSARHRQGAASDVLESMQQLFSGLREVKAFQREAYEVERFEDRTRVACGHAEAAIKARIGSRSWVQMVNDVAVPFLFLAGGYLVTQGLWGLNAGRFGAFLGLVILMYMPVKGLGESYSILNDAVPGVERVFHLFSLTSLVKNTPEATPLEGPIREGLRLESVAFSYPTSEGAVLSEIDFSVPVGTMTAIVGKTGSGKSTLVDLIARYYDPDAGRILVDGRDLRDVSLDSYLTRLATVPQESFLFHDTVRENIRYGRLDASDAEVEEAARRARVHEEILQLEGGYDFVVGERGEKLSGGQRQRVAIARAILRGPELLILDEATSALDPHTERQVQEALQELCRDTTTFVIAHRLSTVQQADQILVLEQGRLVERGTHDELLAQSGVYSTLVSRQLQGQVELEEGVLCLRCREAVPAGTGVSCLGCRALQHTDCWGSGCSACESSKPADSEPVAPEDV